MGDAHLTGSNQITGNGARQAGHLARRRRLETSEELQEGVYDGDPEIRELLDLARKIEGLARNVGTHAAAVVIAEKPV